ncbi:MAG TPA: CDP-alcohol phosphatidyltransferase family protein [Candidatus Pacearchaeota archaeon]|nr:bifunctional IPC transferase and DIPP synthase [archaeon BMS3Abin17]HDK41863.1 CDP-alcohol phosphatidyltransferase family protein [Candidatus Pacearchaeota archaeon]HDZ61220.1 CDP-alcohol phosphatidyltransferase family protein [Candidatus Pacearchaeota archaeon]
MPSVKEIQDVCGRPAKTEPWREKLARKITIRITWFLLKIRPSITPNQVTVVMLFLGIVSAFLFMTGRYGYILLGVLVYHIHLLLDGCDGEIARYKKLYSEKGLYLDYIGHIIINPLIIMGIAIGVYINNPTPFPDIFFLIVGFIGMYSMMINNFLKLKKYEMYIDKKEFSKLKKMQKNFKSQDRRKNPIMDELWQFFRIMTFNSIFFFGILNLLPYLVLINAIVFPVQAIKRFYGEIKRKD